MAKIIIFILNLIDRIYQKKIIKNFKSIFDKNLDIVFDVGAHKGEFIKFITKNFNTKKIYSFEPSKLNFSSLAKTIKKIKTYESEIYLNNFALGEKEETKEFKQMIESSSSTLSNIDFNSNYFKRKNFFLNFGLKSKIFEKSTVNIKSGLSFIQIEKIKKIDLLKIDTEGWEYFVIKGFGESINKVRVIFFEHHYDQMLLKNYTFSNMHNYLVLNGFKQHAKFKMPFRKTFEYIYTNKNYF